MQRGKSSVGTGLNPLGERTVGLLQLNPPNVVSVKSGDVKFGCVSIDRAENCELR